MTENTMPEWLTMQDLTQRYRVSRATIYQWLKKGHYPQPVRLGQRSIRWRRADVEQAEANL